MREPTPFENSVYEICKNIPKGNVATYSTIAHALGKRCYRAVGQALNKNPYAPVVPCHRVVCADSSIGGFGYAGVNKKIQMLREEGINVAKNRIVDFKEKLISSI